MQYVIIVQITNTDCSAIFFEESPSIPKAFKHLKEGDLKDFHGTWSKHPLV